MRSHSEILLLPECRDQAHYLLSSEIAQDVVQGSIACAGWHLAENGETKLRTLQIALVEIAARTGASISFRLRGREIVFPRSGTVVGLRGSMDLLVSSGPGQIRIEGSGGEMVTLVVDAQECQVVGNVQVATIDAGPDLRIIPNCSMLDPIMFSDKAKQSPGREHHQQLKAILQYLRDDARHLHSEMYSLGISIKIVAPVNPHTLRMSWSDRRARNVICLAVTSPEDTLELLVHEFAHLKLCLLQEQFDLLEDHSLPALAPWRPDRRRVDGVFHGVYVFYVVARTFREADRSFPWSVSQARRLTLWLVCIDEGIRQLRRANATPTHVGEMLLARIESWTISALGDARRSGPSDYSWSRAVVRDHLLRAGTPRMSDPWFLAE